MTTKMRYRIFMLSLSVFLATLASLKIPFEQKVLSETETKKNNHKIVFVPPKDAKPKQTTGGASRNQGKCPQDTQIPDPTLTAVIPNQNKGLTIQDSPNFLIYIPDTSAQKAFFSISEITSDEVSSGNHYQTFLPLEQKSGVVQVTLPEDAPKLEIGKTYKWSFALICNTRLKPDSPTVEGFIERVSVNEDLTQQLEKATSLEKAILYAQAGLWYDSTATFLQAYQNQPENLNLMDVWQDLLTSEAVGLEKLSNQTLLK